MKNYDSSRVLIVQISLFLLFAEISGIEASKFFSGAAGAKLLSLSLISLLFTFFVSVALISYSSACSQNKQ